MLDIARSLKAAGKLSFEEIAEITKLPLEEIEKL
jgi:predicted HTH domain antitoxin